MNSMVPVGRAESGEFRNVSHGWCILLTECVNVDPHFKLCPVESSLTYWMQWLECRQLVSRVHAVSWGTRRRDRDLDVKTTDRVSHEVRFLKLCRIFIVTFVGGCPIVFSLSENYFSLWENYFSPWYGSQFMKNLGSANFVVIFLLTFF